MEGFAFLDIIFFAMVAGFLILRLRSVLGRRTGNEKPPFSSRPPVPPREGAEPVPDNVTRFPKPAPELEGTAKPASPVAAEATGSPLEAGLAQIRIADPSFDPRGFTQGARAAFEMTVGAFAAGDTGALRPLLSDEVYENFAAAIRDRQAAKHTLETTLVGINNAQIVEARLDGRTAFVTVKFVTEQVNVTKNAAGEVIDGDSNQVTTVTDVWTFARNTKSRDPNWVLVATGSQH